MTPPALPRPGRDGPTASFYDSAAEAYAAAAWAHPVDDRLAAFARDAPAGAVADVGCGAGRDLAAFRAAGRAAVGLDLSPALARFAADRSGLPVAVGDLAAPPFAPGSLAGVWASACLLHLPRGELASALAALAATLRPGGLLYASLKAGSGSGRKPDGRLFAYHAPEALERAVASCGLEVVDVRFLARPHEGGPGWASLVARRPGRDPSRATVRPTRDVRG